MVREARAELDACGLIIYISAPVPLYSHYDVDTYIKVHSEQTILLR